MLESYIPKTICVLNGVRRLLSSMLSDCVALDIFVLFSMFSDNDIYNISDAVEISIEWFKKETKFIKLFF